MEITDSRWFRPLDISEHVTFRIKQTQSIGRDKPHAGKRGDEVGSVQPT